MTDKKFWLGLSAIVLVLGMAVLGCKTTAPAAAAPFEGDLSLNGKWFLVEDGIEIGYEFNNGNYETFIDGTPSNKGTYTTDNGSISMTLTQMFGGAYNIILGPMFESLGISGYEPQWYSINEFIITTKQLLSGLGRSAEDMDIFITNMFSDAIAVETSTYSVDANTLILLSADEMTLIFTKR